MTMNWFSDTTINCRYTRSTNNEYVIAYPVQYNLVNSILNLKFKFLRDFCLPMFLHAILKYKVLKLNRQKGRKNVNIKIPIKNNLLPTVLKYTGGCENWKEQAQNWAVSVIITIASSDHNWRPHEKCAMFLASLFLFPSITSKSSRNYYTAQC